MSERFGKNEKLKSKIQLDRLFSEGKSLKAFPLKLLFVPIENQKNGQKTHKTGVSAPKRRFKKATDRNKLKRLMREAFRKNKFLMDNTPQKYALLFIYTGKTISTYTRIFAAMEKLLRKFNEREKKPHV